MEKKIKFADDNELGHQSNSMEDINCLQTANNKLKKWADWWWMKFNVGKCKKLCLLGEETSNIYTQWLVNLYRL